MRAAIYIRCATQEVKAVEAQRASDVAYAIHEGHEIASVYEDFGQPGLPNTGTGLKALLADAKVGRFEAIIVDRVYRLSRDAVQLAYFFDYFADCKVTLLIHDLESPLG
ncbi:MAG: recombinase family protein [Aggregatilineales bacterium]